MILNLQNLPFTVRTDGSVLLTARGDAPFYIQNPDADFHSGLSILRAQDAFPGTFSVAIGNNDVVGEYQNRAFISTNPPGGVGAPLDLTICQEEASGAQAYLAHRRIFMDGTANTMTFYGWTDASVTGPVAVFIAATGAVGLGTNTLVSGAEVTLEGDLAFSNLTNAKISFGTGGLSAPGGVGEKITLYGTVAANVANYSIGMNGGGNPEFWFNVAASNSSFNFKQNATDVASISGLGHLAFIGGMSGGVQALSGAGAVNVTTLTTALTSSGVLQALTLADGVNGQIKTIAHDVDGGSMVLTPTTKTGYTTITFTNVGETATLQFFTTRGWMILSLRGAIAA